MKTGRIRALIVSKQSRADLQYLGVRTTLKTVSFYLFCWVLLCQYSKKFDFPGACLVLEYARESIDPGSTLWLG